MKLLYAYAVLGSLLFVSSSIEADEPAPAPPASVAAPARAAEAVNAGSAEPTGASRALIVCGLTGDEEHRKLFAETIERLYAGLTMHHGFESEHLVILWEGEGMETDGAAIQSSRGLASKELIADRVSELASSIQPDDRLWVFVLGHAHYDGRYSWLNLPGPDMQHIEFGRLFADVRCREQVFFITTPASGFYHKSLASPGRIVITATEPDLEVNETLFPHHLSKALGEPPAFRELDLDEDGLLTLLDAYLWTCQQTAREYATNMLLATEHAMLEDSGDGRGTEVQADYLSEELGGRRRAGQELPVPRTGDGARASSIRLSHPSPSPDNSQP